MRQRVWEPNPGSDTQRQSTNIHFLPLDLQPPALHGCWPRLKARIWIDGPASPSLTQVLWYSAVKAPSLCPGSLPYLEWLTPCTSVFPLLLSSNPPPIPPISLWALLNQWGLNNDECVLDLGLRLNARWEFDGGHTPIPCVTDITRIETAENKHHAPAPSSPTNLKHKRRKLQKTHLCELL